MNNESKGFGITSLVCGIIAILFCWCPVVGLVTGILSIVFYAKQRKINTNGLATTGLVTGIIGLSIGLIYNIIWLIMFMALGSMAMI